MGEADQFIKKRFREETARVTLDAVVFESAPEVATASLTPDGSLTLVGEWPPEAAVLAPWTLFAHRAVVDFKMEGDHVDRPALARVELRRMAAWVKHIEEEDEAAPPGRYATLVVAPHLPEWLREARDPAELAVTLADDGCYRLSPRDHVALWVAANELPLHPSLVPFLWARSGRALVKFVRWLAAERGVSSVVAAIQSLPMRSEITRQLDETPADSEIERQRDQEMIQNILKHFPQVANEVRDEGRRETLTHLFAHKLQRPLAEIESTVLAARFRSLGNERVEAVVFSFDAAALARWLADPDAT
jgi:hypothetical protein